MSEEIAVKKRGRPKKTVETEAVIAAENTTVKPRRSRTTVKDTLSLTPAAAEGTRKRTTRKTLSLDDAVEAEIEPNKVTTTTKTKRTRKSVAKDTDNVPTTIAEPPTIDAVALDPASSNILSQAKAFSELRHIDDFVEQLEREDEKPEGVSQLSSQTAETAQPRASIAPLGIAATELQDRLDSIAYDILQTRSDLIDHNLDGSSVIVQSLRKSREQVSSSLPNQQGFEQVVEAHLPQQAHIIHEEVKSSIGEVTSTVTPRHTIKQSEVVSAGPLYARLSATPPPASVDSTTAAGVIEPILASQQLPSEETTMTPLPSARQTSSSTSSSLPSSTSSGTQPKFQSSTSFPSRYLSTSTSTSQKPPRPPPSSSSPSQPAQQPQQRLPPKVTPFQQQQQQQLKQSHQPEPQPQQPNPSNLTIKELRRNPKFRALELKWIGIIVGIPVVVMTSWELMRRYQKQQALLQKSSRERGELTENMPGVESSRNSAGVNVNGGV